MVWMNCWGFRHTSKILQYCACLIDSFLMGDVLKIFVPA